LFVHCYSTQWFGLFFKKKLHYTCFQKLPAFLISNYNTASYLLEIKQRGLRQRKKKAEATKTDYHLYPLTAEEENCAAALQLDLSDMSSFKSMVQSFINGSPHEIPDAHNVRRLNLWNHLDSLRKTGSLDKLAAQTMKRKQEDETHKSTRGEEDVHNLPRNQDDGLQNLTMRYEEDLYNLTRSLLYEIELSNSSLEMDALLVLPTSRLIVGKNTQSELDLS
jgi:hypothetical protein